MCARRRARIMSNVGSRVPSGLSAQATEKNPYRVNSHIWSSSSTSAIKESLHLNRMQIRFRHPVPTTWSTLYPCLRFPRTVQRFKNRKPPSNNRRSPLTLGRNLWIFNPAGPDVDQGSLTAPSAHRNVFWIRPWSLTIIQKDMREIAISKFKATCLAALEEVRRTRTLSALPASGVPSPRFVHPVPRPKPHGWAVCGNRLK